MAVLVLQPSAMISGMAMVEDVAGSGSESDSWREYLQQVCGVVVAGTGVLTLMGLASPTK